MATSKHTKRTRRSNKNTKISWTKMKNEAVKR
jgi:hypothetical protein